MPDRSYVINTFSWIWREPAHDCVARLADQGHREFEILLTAPHLWPADFDAPSRRALAQAAAARGAAITSLNAGGFDFNLASPADDVRAFARSYVAGAMRLAADLGVRDVVLGPGVGRPLLPPPADSLRGWFRAALAQLVREAEALGVRLLVENVPFSFLPRIDAIMAAVEEFPAAHVGVVYDVANAVFAREDPVDGMRKAGARLDLIHLSDTPLESWRHDAIGTGVVPFDRIGAAVREIGYTGPVVLEVISSEPERDFPASIAALSRLGW